ncbi:MAG TPA: hypothetical protein VHD62_12700 [Opitutaceae bacterium]|nr:hypothetical protein [Opitutaceae bacterium]
MNVPRLLALLGLLLAETGGRVLAGESPRASTAERERNGWPFVVARTDAENRRESWSAAGPFLFDQPTVDGGRVGGFRPFWVEAHDARGDFRSAFFLYPLFSYREDENTRQWNVFELIRRTSRKEAAGATPSLFGARDDFEVWPFWFSRQTGDPALSYRGLFPIAGTVRNKLGLERATWLAFPLYAQTEKRGAITTSFPWPFVRVTRGAARGFGLWPLYTREERPGVSREEYFLWPLGYNRTLEPAPDAPAGTEARRDFGALPFYARSTGPGYRDENFLWPFFGYTDRTAPARYHETRYFWPLLVQGRGDGRIVDRWAPFYTHSVIKGYDKTWLAWPLVRRAEWTEPERDLAHTKTQLLYFLYWSERQRSATRPNAPAAELTHVWPLFSAWDNGAGRRQVQVLSPLEVFFPGNEKVRQTWTPFFALVRYDQRAPGEVRASLLWDAVTWERHDADAHREFHVGPLLSVVAQGEAKRVAIGRGLFGFERAAAAGRWRMFWLDFRPKSATTSPPSR